MKITITGVPRTKKNSQSVHYVGVRCPKCKKGTRAVVAPSSAYKVYEAQAVRQIQKPGAPIAHAVNVKCVYYLPLNKDGSMPKRLPDLTNLLEATDDILVRAGVLIDDNLSVIASHDGSRAVFGNEAPRTEIEITEATGWGCVV